MTNSAHLFLPPSSVLRVLNPGSPQARSIFDLGIMAAIIFAIIFVIVAGIIVFALMRFRWREGEADPRQLAGNRKIEIVWTAIPCVIVVALFVLTARAMSLSDPPPAPEPDLVVTGHQWWWEARYTKSGLVVANEFHIPVGKAVSVRLESADVLHEFWVPELARKITAVPGHPNHIWLQADQPGIFLGICSEFCGTQHAWMHFLIVAEPEAEFDAWEHAQLQPAASPTNSSAAKGFALFQADDLRKLSRDQRHFSERAGWTRSHAFREPSATWRRDRRQHAGESCGAGWRTHSRLSRASKCRISNSRMNRSRNSSIIWRLKMNEITKVLVAPAS
jgi:cytochrome c oxidase subunit II